MATALTAAAFEQRQARASVPVRDVDAGLVVGSASGCVASSGQLLSRLFQRGARAVSPIAFPSVLPSALSSAGSIYLGLRGPVWTVADLSASGEAAFFQAASMLAAGEADAMAVAAVEEQSVVIECYVGPTCMDLPVGGQRGEGGAAMIVQTAASAAAVGARPLAKLVWFHHWRGKLSLPAELPEPCGRAAVYHARPAAAALQQQLGPWRHVPAQLLSDQLGHHEAVGAMALALAAAALDACRLDSVLVLGAAPDRGYAVMLQTVDQLMETSAP
jgi:3-oxoacyl-[acyl-carrier-protein] synthase II